MTASITVHARELAAALRYVRKSVALRKSSPAAYHSVLLTVEDGALIIDHTTWDTVATARVEAEDAYASMFTVAVNLDALLDAAKSAAAARLSLTVSHPTGNLIARAGTVSAILAAVVDTGTVGAYPLPSSIGHGQIDASGGLRMTGKALAELVGAVAVAAGKDKTVPACMSIKLAHEGGVITAIATDRYRLMTATTPPRTVAPGGPELAVVAPASWLAETAKHLAKDREVVLTETVRAGHSWLTLSGSSGTFSTDCPTTVRDFPNVAQLFRDPLDTDAVFTVEPAPWAKAIKGWKGDMVRLHVEGGPSMLVEHLDGDAKVAGSVELPAGELRGEPVTAQYTAEFLASILATVPKGVLWVELRIADPNRPLAITWEGARHLLMPRRILT